MVGAAIQSLVAILLLTCLMSHRHASHLSLLVSHASFASAHLMHHEQRASALVYRLVSCLDFDRRLLQLQEDE